MTGSVEKNMEESAAPDALQSEGTDVLESKSIQESRIQELSKGVADKIAAGEVVDRPLSIVKELVENALDAGASSIVVEIRNGGKTYIRVTDDGCGIAKEDVFLAFKRHATSKIREASDLDQIHTLGFRGEALASISAVSKTELITKPAREKLGYRLLVEGGEAVDQGDTGCPDGTTVLVTDLFYNTPARLKFMKKDGTESGLVIDFISKMALAYPKVKLRLINNGNILFSTGGKGDIYANILTIYSRDIGEKLIHVTEQEEEIGLEAYLSPPSQNKTTRKSQIFFVNGRHIVSKVLDRAVEEAYAEKLFEGRYPIVFLFLQTAPNRLDVNIHPNKKEVRFDDERWVREFVARTLRKGLSTNAAISQIRQENLFSRADISRERAGEQVKLSDGKKESTKKQEQSPIHQAFAGPGNATDALSENPGASTTPSVRCEQSPLYQGTTGTTPGSQNAEGTTPGNLEIPGLVSDNSAITATSFDRPEIPGLSSGNQVTTAAAPGNQDAAHTALNNPEMLGESHSEVGKEQEQSELVNIKKLLSERRRAEQAELGNPNMGEGLVSESDRPVYETNSQGQPISPAEADSSQQSELRASGLLHPEPPTAIPFDIHSLRPTGVIFSTYITAVDDQDSFYLIDQHAAHERIFYERLLAEYNRRERHSQMLLTSFVVEVPYSMKGSSDDWLICLNDLGFAMEEFGGRSYRVSEIPMFMTMEEGKSFIDYFLEHADQIQPEDPKKLSQIISRSCKSAVKAHDRLAPEEIHQLLADLATMRNPFSCPHGRPTFIKMTKYQIEKMFLRA